MSPRHGTYERWMRGCLCDECYTAHVRVRDARAGKIVWYRGKRTVRQATSVRARKVVHGKRSTYVAGCHCDPCAAAEREYGRQRRAKKRSVVLA